MLLRMMGLVSISLAIFTGCNPGTGFSPLDPMGTPSTLPGATPLPPVTATLVPSPIATSALTPTPTRPIRWRELKILEFAVKELPEWKMEIE